MKSAGLVGRLQSWRSSAVPLVQQHRRDIAVDGARPPGRDLPPRASCATVQQAAADAAERLLEEVVQPLRLAAVDERTPGRLVVMATTTPYDMVKPFGRPAGPRRRDRHRILGHDSSTTDLDGLRRVECPAARPRSTNGPTASTSPELRLQRQRVRRASCWPLSGTFVVDPNPRLAHGAGHRRMRWPTIGLFSRRQRHRQYRRQPGDSATGAELHPPAVLPVRQVRHRRDSTSPRQARRSSSATARATRSDGHRRRSRSRAPTGRLGSSARRSSTHRSSVRSPRSWVALRVDGAPAATNRSSSAEALERGDMVAVMPQGTIPRGKAFYDPKLEDVAPPGWQPCHRSISASPACAGGSVRSIMRRPLRRIGRSS